MFTKTICLAKDLHKNAQSIALPQTGNLPKAHKHNTNVNCAIFQNTL